MRFRKKKDTAAAIILLILTAVFVFGIKTKDTQETFDPTEAIVETIPENGDDKQESQPAEQPEKAPVQDIKPADTPKNEATPSSEPEEKKEQPADVFEEEKQELKCSISVRCDTALNNKSLSAEKQKYVPENGIIYAERTVEFEEGETVFDVLYREMKQNGIHMEFKTTPAYNSKYIQGINNLYEFDCGELSGWIYRVNGETPNVGCSQYELKNGDKIEWIYSCNLGKDV